MRALSSRLGGDSTGHRRAGERGVAVLVMALFMVIALPVVGLMFDSTMLFIIKAKLVSQKRRREIVVGLPDDLTVVSHPVIVLTQREVEAKRAIDPAIAAFTILDPDLNLFKRVEEIGQLQ